MQQSLEELGQFRAPNSQIPAPVSEILGDEIDLLGTLSLELLRFLNQPSERLRAMLAAHQRDRAERAGVIAPLGNLQIPHMGLLTQELAHTRMRCDGVFD